MVDSLMTKFSMSGLAGTMLWSWDTMSDKVPWAMESLADVIGVRWNSRAEDVLQFIHFKIKTPITDST